jgi:hypothetical protein
MKRNEQSREVAMKHVKSKFAKDGMMEIIWAAPESVCNRVWDGLNPMFNADSRAPERPESVEITYAYGLRSPVASTGKVYCRS